MMALDPAAPAVNTTDAFALPATIDVITGADGTTSGAVGVTLTAVEAAPVPAADTARTRT